MKKNIKAGLALLLLTAMLCGLMAGCANNSQYEVASYQGQRAEGQLKSEFNKELFYCFSTHSCLEIVSPNLLTPLYWIIRPLTAGIICTAQ